MSGKHLGLLCALSLLALVPLAAADWVLGAMSFSPAREDSSVDGHVASLVPRLILEQISSGATHLPLASELNARSLYDLQTERLSLFLQLSREIRARDSLALSALSARQLKKKRAEADSLIARLKRQIDENLAETERQRSSLAVRSSDVLEQVSLYRHDSTALYEFPAALSRYASDSPLFERQVLDDGLNALLTGTVTTYGDYAAVSAELRVFPGNILAASATEVGSMQDVTMIARNLAYDLLPGIANALPVHLYVEILPVEARADATLFIDGVLVQGGDWSAEVAAGLHTIEVDCDGYFGRSITYNFVDSAAFSIELPLEKKQDGAFSLVLADVPDGSLYANADFVGAAGSQDSPRVRINGDAILGQFVVPTADGGTIDSYYYVPEALQQDDARLALSVRPRDTEQIIDTRRIWMYRGYSALMLSLPLTFYSVGKYKSVSDGYAVGAVSKTELNNWRRMEQVSIGVSLVAGGFFVYELIRYLRAANSVLPTEAYSIDAGD